MANKMNIEVTGMETFTMGRKLEVFRKRYEEMLYGKVHYGVVKDREGTNVNNLKNDIDKEKCLAQELIRICELNGVYQDVYTIYIIRLNELLENIKELEFDVKRYGRFGRFVIGPKLDDKKVVIERMKEVLGKDQLTPFDVNSLYPAALEEETSKKYVNPEDKYPEDDAYYDLNSNTAKSEMVPAMYDLKKHFETVGKLKHHMIKVLVELIAEEKEFKNELREHDEI